MPLDYIAPGDCLFEHCEKASIIIYHNIPLAICRVTVLVKFRLQTGTPSKRLALKGAPILSEINTS